MTMIRRFIAGTLFTALSIAACSSTPDTSMLLGRWTYQKGSAIAIDCTGAAPRSIDLSMVPPSNQPGYFTFSAGAADVVHEVDARGCSYDWTVFGGLATAKPDQSCANFPDGKGGSQSVHLVQGTKSTLDGVSMNVDVHFTNDAGCAISVTGTARRM
jgi:hypothetical protein